MPTHLCPTRTAQDLLDAVIVDCKVGKFSLEVSLHQIAYMLGQVLNHKNQEIRPPGASSTGGEVSTEQVFKKQKIPLLPQRGRFRALKSATKVQKKCFFSIKSAQKVLKKYCTQKSAGKSAKNSVKKVSHSKECK